MQAHHRIGVLERAAERELLAAQEEEQERPGWLRAREQKRYDRRLANELYATTTRLDVDAVRLLLELPVATNAIDLKHGKHSWTPLMFASQGEPVYGYDVTLQGHGAKTRVGAKETPRTIALVKLLLEHGADRDVRSSHGVTAREIAIWNKLPTIAELLSSSDGPRTEPPRAQGDP